MKRQIGRSWISAKSSSHITLKIGNHLYFQKKAAILIQLYYWAIIISNNGEGFIFLILDVMFLSSDVAAVVSDLSQRCAAANNCQRSRNTTGVFHQVTKVSYAVSSHHSLYGLAPLAASNQLCN